MSDDDMAVTASSGNVFADLDLPEADEAKFKVRLAVAVNRVIADRKLTQAEAARLMATTQPKVSALANYKLADFSVGRLFEFLTDMELDVDVSIRPACGRGRLLVHEAA